MLFPDIKAWQTFKQSSVFIIFRVYLSLLSNSGNNISFLCSLLTKILLLLFWNICNGTFLGCGPFFLPLNLFYRVCWFYIFILFREVLKFWVQHLKLLRMSPLLPMLCITICTNVRKIFDISLVVGLLIYSKKMFCHLAE